MRGYCGIGIQGPKFPRNIGGLHRAVFAFGADWFFTIGEARRGGPEDVNRTARHIPRFCFADDGDFLAHLPEGASLVCVEIAGGAVDLPRFAHPERAVYVLGPEDGSVGDELRSAARHVVVIPTRVCLNVAQAAAIVLYDRTAKRAGQGRLFK